MKARSAAAIATAEGPLECRAAGVAAAVAIERSVYHGTGKVAHVVAMMRLYWNRNRNRKFVYPKGLVHVLAVFVDEVHVVEHGTPEASAHGCALGQQARGSGKRNFPFVDHAYQRADTAAAADREVYSFVHALIIPKRIG